MNEILQAERDKQKWESMIVSMAELDKAVGLNKNTMIDVTVAINEKLDECNAILKCRLPNKEYAVVVENTAKEKVIIKALQNYIKNL